MIHEDLTKFDLSSLKYCTIAGEALNPAVFETFKKLTGIKLMEGFGQTETTLTIATMPWMEPKPGSMGLPNPQYDVDLIDHEGRSVEAGEQGQIVIRTSKGKPLDFSKNTTGMRNALTKLGTMVFITPAMLPGKTRTATFGLSVAQTT